MSTPKPPIVTALEAIDDLNKQLAQTALALGVVSVETLEDVTIGNVMVDVEARAQAVRIAEQARELRGLVGVLTIHAMMRIPAAKGLV